MEKIHNEKRENKGKQNRRLAMENRPIAELAIEKSRLSDLEISQSMSEGSKGPESKVFNDTSIGRIEIIEESPNNNLCIRLVSKYNSHQFHFRRLKKRYYYMKSDINSFDLQPS